jgi:hypothetical protein
MARTPQRQLLTKSPGRIGRGFCYIRGMKKMLPLLFAATLLVSGCSKSDDAQPAAKQTGLQGRWQLSSDVLTEYNSTGAVIRTTPTVLPATISMELTATQYIGYINNTVDKTINYTKNGNVLHFGTGTAPSDYKTITEQTDTRLVWVTPKDVSNPGPYPAVYTTTYTR